MTDEELADALIGRLNALIADPAVRADVGRLIEARVPCSKAVLEHPSIQASQPEEAAGLCECGAYGPPSGEWCAVCRPEPRFGFLGLLNGLVGTIPDGPRRGWGYVVAEFDGDGALVRFLRTAPPTGILGPAVTG